MQDAALKKSCQRRINIKWPSGQISDEGNKLAHRESKLAVRGDEFSSLTADLSPRLRYLLPLSISTLKQMADDKSKPTMCSKVLW